MRLQPIGFLLLAAALLAACAAPSQAPASPASPSPAASAPAATAAPTAAGPSGTITRQAVLPAPLYVLDQGQIARIERDGVTRAQVTRERIDVEGYPPVNEFDAGPGGRIAYVVGDVDADRLSVADGRGGEPEVLYSVPGHELSDLLWSPDGAAIYLRLLNNNDPPDIPGGLYRLPAAGGELALIVADDPVDDPVTPSRDLFGYSPVAFSPDGATLLLEADSLFYEDCAIATLPVAGGAPALVTLPEGAQTYCGEADWADDGGVLFLAGPPSNQPGGGPTIWRAPAAGGAAEQLGGPDQLARAPVAVPRGGVRFFHVRLPADQSGEPSYAPAELGRPGAAGVDLGQPFTDALSLALWAPDATGAVVVLESPEQGRLLRWLPLNGAPLDLPQTGGGVTGLRWAAE